MKTNTIIKHTAFVFFLFEFTACKLIQEPIKIENKIVPATFAHSQDSTNSAKIKWRNYFNDPNLIDLIDTALENNQELNIVKQEIIIALNEVRSRKGEYLPSGSLGLGMGLDKAGRYTWDGLAEEDQKNKQGDEPKHLGDFTVNALFSWELDIWNKLRTEKNAAVARYLASVEGKNFLVTSLIDEIANSYFELEALDNQLAIVKQNITIQESALRIIKLQKEAGRVSQLAVNRFQAQLFNTQNLQFDLLQQIVETENKINMLTGRFPKPIVRNSMEFNNTMFNYIAEGIPSQLLENRADIRQAEKLLTANNLDVAAAKASFYPTVHISASIGLQAFNPVVWFKPQSLLYSLFGDLISPLINRNGLKAAFYTSKAKQVQAVFSYEKTILNAFLEVNNQLSSISNFRKSYETKSNEVDILTQSITISDNLFKSAKADYMEVLLTQREALESKMQLIEIKKKQLHAEISIYKALGGGWN